MFRMKFLMKVSNDLPARNSQKPETAVIPRVLYFFKHALSRAGDCVGFQQYDRASGNHLSVSSAIYGGYYWVSYLVFCTNARKLIIQNY